MRIIKKYKNRKLFDTVESEYVNLADIESMVKRGEHIQVLDWSPEAFTHLGRPDITGEVLLQVLVNNPHNAKGVYMLENIIANDLLQSEMKVLQ